MRSKLIKPSVVFSLGCLLFLSFSLQAQWNKGITGSGNVIEQNRNLSGFTGIKASSGVDVVITQGNQDQVIIKADDNIADKITTKIDGDALIISVAQNTSIRNAKSFKVLVTVKNLKNLTASGGSDVFSEGTLSFESLNIKANGGSDIKMDLNTQDLICEIHGGSDAKLEGTTKYLVVEAFGGSDFEGKGLKAENGKLKVSGGSDAYIHVTGELSMEASGASDIHYMGNPKITYQRSSGGSDIYGN